MPRRVIEVLEQSNGWVVSLGSKVHGLFGASAEAVAYALTLSETVGRAAGTSEPEPRVRVRFGVEPQAATAD